MTSLKKNTDNSTRNNSSYSLNSDTKSSTLIVELNGNWREKEHQEITNKIFNELSKQKIKTLLIDTTNITNADTHIINFLLKFIKFCKENNINFDSQKISKSYKSLIELSTAVTPRKGSKRSNQKENNFILKLSAYTENFLEAVSYTHLTLPTKA